MANILDVRGLSCPLPLLRTQTALAAAVGNICILADEPAAKEKIIKYARSQKFAVEWAETSGEYTINISK